jgi:hypothetical protein
VVITTNEERELPAAFVRRCLVLNLQLPRERGRIHRRADRTAAGCISAHAAPPRCIAKPPAAVARPPGGRGPGPAGPGQAEYLDLLRVVVTLAPESHEAIGAARQGAGLRAQETPAGRLMKPRRCKRGQPSAAPTCCASMPNRASRRSNARRWRSVTSGGRRSGRRRLPSAIRHRRHALRRAFRRSAHRHSPSARQPCPPRASSTSPNTGNPTRRRGRPRGARRGWPRARARRRQLPGSGSVRLPARQPLTRWSRLWPFLRSALGQTVATRQPDLPRLLDRLTRGEVLRAIPMLSATAGARASPSSPTTAGRPSRFTATSTRSAGPSKSATASSGSSGASSRRARPAAAGSQAGCTAPRSAGSCRRRDAAADPQRPRPARRRARNAARLAAVRRPPAQRRRAGAGPLPAARAPHPASLQRCFEIVEWDRHSLLRRSLTQVASDPGADRRRQRRQLSRQTA